MHAFSLFESFVVSSHQQSILAGPIGQFGSENQPGVLPPIDTIVPIGLVRQLVDVHVYVPVETHIGAVRPDNPRVANVRNGLECGGAVFIE